MKTSNPGAPRSMLCALVVVNWLALLGVTADEAKPKVDFATGQKAPGFAVKTTDGKSVRFPEDYRGKVVLLDFWATWCGPCRAELPNVVTAYEKYHAQGLEVLGISLDKPNATTKLALFAKENNMSWPQVYDGKFWQAALAVRYGVHAIPQPLLVDGDTGIILAEGKEARGPKLARSIAKALAGKPKK